MTHASQNETGEDGLSSASVHRESLESARQQLEAMPSSTTQRLALSELYFRLAVLPNTEIEAAIDLLRQATTYDPYHPKLFFHLGRLLHLNGEPLAAIFEYRRAQRLAPKSHRISVHLALALLDAGPEECEVAWHLFAALFAGDNGKQASAIAETDKLIAKRAGSGSEHAQSSAKRSSADTLIGQGNCRWRGFWKVLLVTELGRSTAPKKSIQMMEAAGKSLGEGQDGIAEYALAGLLFLIDSAARTSQVEAWLREPAMTAHQDRPAVRLLHSVCELGAATSAEDFVRLACVKLQNGELPPELVCCLHYSWHGQSGKQDAVEASRLVEQYPKEIATLPSFRELRVAILDYHARIAWGGERLDRAEILWQEACAADPFRIPVMHNLALVATRTRDVDKYQRSWERAAELRYMIAGAAGDLRVELEDRIRFHRSFAQQSRLRHVKSIRSGDPLDTELLAWLEDRETFDFWLLESATAFLNQRLRFQSPLHLLGITLDCSDDSPQAAAEALLRQFQMCFRNRRWAGILTFQALMEELTAKAAEFARDPIQRKRDLSFEAENSEAEKLTKEIIGHGFLLFRMIRLGSESASGNVQFSALRAGAYLVNMPWRFLEPACKKMGMVPADTDLVKVFVSYIVALAHVESSKDATAQINQRLEILEDCLRGAPDVLGFRLMQCSLLLKARLFRQAYLTALDALPLTAKMADQKEAEGMRSQFIAAVDNAVLEQIPQQLRSPTRDSFPAFIAEVQRLLAEYPKAGGVRLMAASILIRTGRDDPARLKTAKEMLEQGLDQLLSDEQIREARELLEKAGSETETLDVVSRIRDLLESAAASARLAVQLTAGERTPSKTREAREKLESAVHEASEAEELAVEAKLDSAAESARALSSDLRKILEELKRG
jgi:hypothetical protein